MYKPLIDTCVHGCTHTHSVIKIIHKCVDFVTLILVFRFSENVFFRYVLGYFFVDIYNILVSTPYLCHIFAQILLSLLLPFTMLRTTYLEERDQIPPLARLAFKGKNGDYLA